jgi:hypothetical protein
MVIDEKNLNLGGRQSRCSAIIKQVVVTGWAEGMSEVISHRIDSGGISVGLF